MMPAWFESYRSLHPVPQGMLAPGARLSKHA
jgi:hypothetical protein